MKTEFLTLEKGDFLRLQTAIYSIEIPLFFGPRMTSFSLKGKPNLLAELPDAKESLPDGRFYEFQGGHRLWLAPEKMPETYLPDKEVVRVLVFEKSCEIVGERQAELGVTKKILLEELENGWLKLSNQLIFDEVLEEKHAAWAITMLRKEGRVILPFKAALRDEDGYWANRQLNLWSYTNLGNPCFHFEKEWIEIEAEKSTEAAKIGFLNTQEWQVFQFENQLFVKYIRLEGQQDFPDLNSSSQCYVCPDFVELESVSPLFSQQKVIEQIEFWKILEVDAHCTTQAIVEIVEAMLHDLKFRDCIF